MATVAELLRQGKKSEIWHRYCGFMDMNIEEFMAMQRSLLEEQLPRISGSPLGKEIMKGAAPRTLEEFRQQAPFTTYRNYAPYFLSRDESVLPEKPFIWAHTSGKSGEYEYKWIPYTRRMYDLWGEISLACFILAAAKRRGDVALREGMKLPYLIAPPPYASGLAIHSMLEQFPFRIFPPIEEAVKMDFPGRVAESFRYALSEGLDFFFGVSSVLMKISETFKNVGKKGSSSVKMRLNGRILLRLLPGLLKSRLRGRDLLPKDIWKVKGAICGGMDTSILMGKVAESWGIYPLEIYGSTEFSGMATQAWDRKGFVFFPNICFWEFIPENDYRSYVANPAERPKSLLLSEVKPGAEYVVVGTTFHGGALVRYIIEDLIKVISLEDANAGIHLPQINFVSRTDDIIDIGGFTRLTEKTIWQAIESSGVPYEEWTIRKEPREKQPILRLYMELRQESGEAVEITERIHESLKRADAPYRDLEEMAGIKPLVVTLLSKGTFLRYYEERQAAGADLAHLKPPHVNATDPVIEKLLRMSSWKI